MQKLSVQFRFFQILSNIFQYNCPKNVVGCRSSPITVASRTDSDGYLPHAHRGADLHRTYVGTSTRFSSGHEHELGRRRRAGACLPLPPGRRGTTVMLPTAPIEIPCQLPRRGPAPLCLTRAFGRTGSGRSSLPSTTESRRHGTVDRSAAEDARRDPRRPCSALDSTKDASCCKGKLSLRA